MNFQERRYELLTDKFNKMGQKIVNHQSGFLGLDVGEGRVPRVGVEEQFPQGDAGDITQALAYVQKKFLNNIPTNSRNGRLARIFYKKLIVVVRERPMSIGPAKPKIPSLILLTKLAAHPVREKRL